MNKEALDYLKTQRVGVLAVEMLDGSPHAATVHFANSGDTFVFETDRDYRKCEPLFGREVTRASFVVGSNEEDMQTLQLDGEARILSAADSALKEMYLTKFPEKRAKAEGEKVVFFTFTPTWWRFTDWTRPEGKTIFTSDGQVVVVGKS